MVINLHQCSSIHSILSFTLPGNASTCIVSIMQVACLIDGSTCALCSCRVDKGRFIGIVNRVADPLSGSSQLDSVKQAQSQKDAAKAQQELVKEVEEEESDVLLAKDVMQDAMTDVLTRRGLLNTTTSGAHSAVAAWARRAGSAAGAGSLSSEGSEEEGKAEALGRR
jgi:hypothetical protein